MEIDISDKVNKIVRYGFLTVLLLTIVCSGTVWWWQQSHGYLSIHNASIKGVGVNASVKVAGQVTEVVVNDGDMVEAGQTLAKIKIKTSPEQIKQLETAVETAKLRYNELLTRPAQTAVSTAPAASNRGDTDAAQAALDKAASNKERMDKLFEIGAISAVQRNNADRAYQAAQEALNAAQQTQSMPQENFVPTNRSQDHAQLLKLAQFQLEQAESALKASKEGEQITPVLAPVAGTVNFTNVKTGEDIEAGQPIFTIGETNNVWVEVQVDEEQIEKIKLGQYVDYDIEAYPGESFKGTIFEIASEMPQDGETMQGLPVKISLPADTDHTFKAGMKVNIKIRTN